MLPARWRLQVSLKGRSDIVTDADIAVEKAVLELVRREFPDFGILAEESQPVTTDSPMTGSSPLDRATMVQKWGIPIAKFRVPPGFNSSTLILLQAADSFN